MLRNLIAPHREISARSIRLDIQIDKSTRVLLDLFVELESLLVGQRHRVEIPHDDPIALQPSQLIVAVRFLSPSQSHTEAAVNIPSARVFLKSAIRVSSKTRGRTNSWRLSLSHCR